MNLSTLGAAFLLLVSPALADAQGYLDQSAVEPLLESQGSSISPVTPVTWHRYEIGRSGRNSKTVLAKLRAHLDSLPGDRTEQRLAIVEISNRVNSKYLMQRSSILIPDAFPEDFRAYSPYPITYGAATSVPKLFVADKYTQTFAAYEYGQLVRWGLICTGREDNLTPAGRYNFNWKQEYRESSEAPVGETWKMRWVFNFYEAAGIHVHQYQLPLATPASHGCVRMSEADARWNFGWADARSKTSDGTTVIVLNYNPAGLAAHWTEDGSSLVMLPEQDPLTLPAGGKNRQSFASSVY